MRHPQTSGSAGKPLVAVGTVLVIGGLLTAIVGSGLLGGAAMFVGFIVFVIGRLV